MKKTVSTILILALAACMSISVFAANVSDKDIDVTAKYETTTQEAAVYSVDITWESMTFAYSEEVTKEWNPNTHTYTETVSGGWGDKTSAAITVTNHSNAAVDVAFALNAVANTGVTCALDKTSGTLAKGEEGGYDTAPALTAALSVSGKPTTVSSDGVKVASVTITVTGK